MSKTACPPVQVWCATLERRAAGSSASELGAVFIALHQDLYNGDWVVHEAAADVLSTQSFEVASAIGCKLST